MTRQLCLVLVGLVVLGALESDGDARRRRGRGRKARPAKRKPPVDPSEQILIEKARKAYREGTELYTQTKYVAAIEAFEKAYQLKANYRVHCSIAMCYQSMGQPVEAAERYQRCLAEGGAKSSAAKDIQASLRQVEGMITHVDVSSPGEGGTVYLDGEARGPAPQRLSVNPGSHVVEVRREDAIPAKETFKTVGGEEKVLSLVPTPRPEVAVKVTEPLKEEPPSRRRLRSYWFWASAGLSLALATTAAVLGAQTWGLREDYLDEKTEAAYNRFLDRRLMTNIFAFSAVAAAGGATVLFFYTDFGGKSKERPVDQREAMFGVGLQGTF